ncbi:hypothetical protein [Burkholderia gladioli]|uniref:hypothetical protein n=1 Tax=Burkholderia gladioli TaxID=28095 RepID=UPI000CFF2339|nr:hypothetical protein [Burkholderia gladioli]PRH37735.1 hypothetical protein C6V07_01480 [Burkholderia gladioli]
MSESKQQWTPGPWSVVGNMTRYVEGRAPSGLIQEVAACGPTEAWEQQEANAKLIAAAPELVEALSDLLATLERHMPGLGANAKPGTPVAKARAALAKAGA